MSKSEKEQFYLARISIKEALQEGFLKIVTSSSKNSIECLKEFRDNCTGKDYLRGEIFYTEIENKTKMTNNSLLQTAIELIEKFPDFDKATGYLRFNGWTISYISHEQTTYYSSKEICHILKVNEHKITNSRDKANVAILTALIADLERHLGVEKQSAINTGTLNRDDCSMIESFAFSESFWEIGEDDSLWLKWNISKPFTTVDGKHYKPVELGKGEE